GLTDGEVTGQGAITVFVNVEIGCLEDHVWEFFRVEEVISANMCVTVSVAGINGSGLDNNLDGGICWSLSNFNLGIPFVELATNLGNHCVTSNETNGGVGWVEGVRTGEVRHCVLLSSLVKPLCLSLSIKLCCRNNKYYRTRLLLRHPLTKNT